MEHLIMWRVLIIAYDIHANNCHDSIQSFKRRISGAASIIIHTINLICACILFLMTGSLRNYANVARQSQYIVVELNLFGKWQAVKNRFPTSIQQLFSFTLICIPTFNAMSMRICTILSNNNYHPSSHRCNFRLGSIRIKTSLYSSLAGGGQPKYDEHK